MIIFFQKLIKNWYCKSSFTSGVDFLYQAFIQGKLHVCEIY